jgi:hypothetical protein
MAKIITGDAVLTKDGRAGIIRSINERGDRAGVQFVHNGHISFFLVQNLTRMTLEQIADSPISGVGCNQAMEL